MTLVPMNLRNKRIHRIFLNLVFIFSCLLGWTSSAWSMPFIIESHVIQPNGTLHPVDSKRIFAPLLNQLHQLGALTNTATTIEKTISVPANKLSSQQLEQATGFAEKSYTHWLQGEFHNAIKQSDMALNLYRQAPAIVSASTNHRTLVHKALVTKALANKRLNRHTIKHAVITEIIRSYPERGIERSLYGPEAYRMYVKAKQLLNNHPVGNLHISVADPASVIFLNERYINVGSAQLNNLLSGNYRVYIKRGNEEGRLHHIHVAANETTKLLIDSWDFETTLKSHPFAGFSFKTQHLKKQFQNKFALKLAHAINTENIIVLEIQTNRKLQRSLVGSLFSIHNKPIRSAAIPVESITDKKQIQMLAEFLLNRSEAISSMPLEHSTIAYNQHKDTGSVAPWLMTSLGIAAMTFGSWLIYLDGYCTDEHRSMQCQTVYDTKSLGIGAAIVGGIISTTGIYLWSNNTDDVALIPEVSKSSITLTALGKF